MKLIVKLDKPYTEHQKCDFIVNYNHYQGYVIRETETALEAWGLDDDEIIEEKKDRVRNICSQYINEISWRVERYNTQKTIQIETSDSDEMYLNILKYMEYCREYDDQEDNWWDKDPLTFNEWLEPEVEEELSIENYEE